MGLFDIFKKAISPTNQNTRPAFQEILIPERSEPQPPFIPTSKEQIVATGYEAYYKNGVLYKHGEYYIQNLFKTTGMPYKNTLEQLGRTKTSIAPELVKSIEKDGEMFIISRIKGTKTGDLIPLDSVRDKVPKENLLAAFHDLQQVTKAGITDNRILRSPDLWFVSPDDLKVVLPEWSQTRPLLPNEGKDVLDRYYKTLFNK